MKIYFHLCEKTFTNCYIVVNDDPNVKEAIIIDPGKVSTTMIQQIEDGGYKLTGVLITHSHKSHVEGLKTLLKIYSPKVYAADFAIDEIETVVLHGDGKKKIAGLKVEYKSLPGHSSDGMIFKIGEVIFTGDSLAAGEIGKTTSKYANKLLEDVIKEKIFTYPDETVIFPGFGPPSTVQSEKEFNLDFNK